MDEAAGDMLLPLRLGSLGILAAGKSFDDKIPLQKDFQFNGKHGGDTWKGKVERYFISKVPALERVLQWAEKVRLPKGMESINGDLYGHAVGSHIAVAPYMTPLEAESLSGMLWGFLSNCVSDDAETIFKGAATLNGIDAWRRIVRFIDHGRGIRLEQLRAEVRALHGRPIRSLEVLDVGIAEFENKINEYKAAGGEGYEKDGIMKSDLLAILPHELRDNLLWQATDGGSYATFRDTVKSQAAKVLLNRKKLPIHSV